MISAAEARQMATDLLVSKVNIQLEEIEEKIVNAAENGDMCCQIEGYLFPQVNFQLKQAGYTIKINSAKNETWTTIRWDV